MSENTDSTVAYFDANVWVAYMLDASDRNFLFANKLIDEINNGAYIVYVSDLVLLETISSLRRKIAEKSLSKKTKHSPPVQRKTVAESIESKVSAFLTILNTFEKEKKVINMNPRVPIDKLHHDSFVYLSKQVGKIRPRGKFYRYAGLNHWDFQHALIATELGADVFYTADKEFKELEKLPQFASLKFVIRSDDAA